MENKKKCLKTARSHLISILIALLMLCSIATPASATSSYDADKALAYAKAHWNDGNGLCAEFVSDCLKAGGCTAWSKGATTLARLLKNSSYGTYQKLKLGENGYIKVSENQDKISAGDPVFCYCPKCNANTHVVLYSGNQDASGYMKCYAHNSAKNNDVWKLYCAEHPSAAVSAYVYHISSASNATNPDSTFPQYFTCNVQIDFTKTVYLYSNPGDSNRVDQFSSGKTANSTYGAILSDGSTWYRVRAKQLEVIKTFWLKYESGKMTVRDLNSKPAPNNFPQYFNCNVEINCIKGKIVNLYNKPGDSERVDYFSNGQSATSTYGAKLSDGSIWYRIGVTHKDSGKDAIVWLKYESNKMTVKDLDSKPAPAQNPAKLTFSPASLTLDLSSKKTQEITITASGSFPEGSLLYYSMSNSNIATDDWSRCKEGKVFKPVITAKSAGETTLTCTAMKGETVITTAQLKIIVTGSTAPSSYTIKYDANGGKNAPASQTKTAQKALTLDRAQPTRDGYTFAGWATTKDGSTQYQPGEQYNADKDVTLYAVWKKADSKASLTLAKNSFNLNVGEEVDIDFTVTGDPAYVAYRIENEDICKQSGTSWEKGQKNGAWTFEALSPGKTTVTISITDESFNLLASQTATITVSGRATSNTTNDVKLRLGPYMSDVEPGSEVRLNFEFTGEVDGMFFDIEDRSVFTDHGGELNFDQHTGYYSFEALSPGTTDITIILYEGEGASYKVLASETVSITVKKTVGFYQPSGPATDTTISVLALDQTAMTLMAGGDNAEIHATAMLGKPITWDVSGEPGVIFLSYIPGDGSIATICPIGAGIVTVTATTIYNGEEYESSCIVTVVPEMSVSLVPGIDTIYTAPMGQ